EFPHPIPDLPVMPETTHDRPVIAVLPDRLIDQIAAGEVIERPASVVKELIENSLDAGATQIDIDIQQAGSGLIRVVDNGTGMTPDDVAACVQRHATSKIARLEDLSSLLTFGFRGEALASIASVSHLEIISRRRGQDAAVLMFWEGGTLSDQRDTGAAVGTSVSVRHLFYNTPARREFMRAPTTETRRLIETVTDAACVNYRVGFTLTLDERPTIATAPAPDMKTRLVDLFGASLADMLIPFSGGEGELSVHGFAGKPEIARANRDRILTYVNNRRVTALSLAHAATAAYGETIPRGRFPFTVICIEADPSRVDVNVHPTKREVRFANDRAVYELTYYAINKAAFSGPHALPVLPIRETAMPAESTPLRLPLRAAASPETPLAANDRTARAEFPASAPGMPSVEVPSVAHGLTFPARSGESLSASMPDQPQRDASSASPSEHDDITNLWQFNDLYIIAAVGEELWVIDQHTAHERVLYEEILRRIHERKPDIQRLLFPESVDLEAREWEVYESSAELLASLGFEVRPFGSRTVLLEGIPTGLRLKNPVLLFRRVLEDLESARRGGEDLTRAAAASMACRSAVMSGDRLNLAEMQGLFARLMHTENPFSCPHGRPTMVKIPIADFDKKFCR
ncbi:MAG: DNA mismatch repair endonuclease MutL, partial [Candidatus Zixiibacteriota bacterium]